MTRDMTADSGSLRNSTPSTCDRLLKEVRCSELSTTYKVDNRGRPREKESYQERGLIRFLETWVPT